MKRYLNLILLVAVTLLLVGCMDVTQELWINADGSGKMSMDIGMSEEMASLGASGGTTGTEGIPSNPTEEMNNTFSKDPNIKNVQTDEYTKDKMKHWVIKFDIVNFEKFIADSKKDKSFDLSLEKLPNGNYLFKQNIKMEAAAAEGAPAAGSDTGGDEMAQAMMAAFEGHYFTVIVHAPKVVNHNGKMDDKTKAVEWKVPMKDLMGGKGEPIVASLEYTTASGGFLDNLGLSDLPEWAPYAVVGLCCLCLVVLVIVVVVVIVVMKKKKSQAG